jgi:hypothetical protein
MAKGMGGLHSTHPSGQAGAVVSVVVILQKATCVVD